MMSLDVLMAWTGQSMRREKGRQFIDKIAGVWLGDYWGQ